MKLTKKLSGFTLLEILLVVAAIGILAGIVIFAINPAKQLGETRNAQRKVDVKTIADATYQYYIQNPSVGLPATITTTATEICKTGVASCSSLIDLSVLTVNSTYLTAIPIDPSNSSTNGTGYRISKDAYNRIIVSAPLAENSTTISITK